MEVCREGLKQFYRFELRQEADEKKSGENPDQKAAEQQLYFIETEYHILRQGNLHCFLPVQLRESDGKKDLYYDITGLASLREEAGKGSLSGDLCREIVKGILTLFEELESNLLETSHVSFDPGKIFYSSRDGLLWMYLPDSEENPSLAASLEDLFSWMLTCVDYDDGSAVKFVYQVFWRVRRQGCTKEVLERCLLGSLSQVQDQEDHQSGGLKETSGEKADYDAFFGILNETDEKADSSRIWAGQTDREEGVHGESREGNRWLLLIRIILIAAGILACLGAAFFAGLGLLKGFTEVTLAYLAACILLGTAFLALGIWSGGFGKEKKTEEISHDSKELPRQDPVRESFPDYGDPGKTTLLSSRREDCYASLRALDSGELFLIRDNPYHIGSDGSLNHLVINSGTISRQHAVICYDELEENYLLSDLGSTNGSWVDQMRLKRDQMVPLRDGCHIRFAQEEYAFGNPRV